MEAVDFSAADYCDQYVQRERLANEAKKKQEKNKAECKAAYRKVVSRADDFILLIQPGARIKLQKGKPIDRAKVFAEIMAKLEEMKGDKSNRGKALGVTVYDNETITFRILETIYRDGKLIKDEISIFERYAPEIYFLSRKKRDAILQYVIGHNP